MNDELPNPIPISAFAGSPVEEELLDILSWNPEMSHHFREADVITLVDVMSRTEILVTGLEALKSPTRRRSLVVLRIELDLDHKDVSRWMFMCPWMWGEREKAGHDDAGIGGFGAWRADRCGQPISSLEDLAELIIELEPL